MASGMTFSVVRLGSATKLTAVWVADGSGNISATTSVPILGKVVSVAAIPGTPTPSDNYTVIATDPDGVPVLNAQLTGNCKAASVVIKTQTDTLGYVAQSPLTIAVSGAGADKAGKVVIILEAK